MSALQNCCITVKAPEYGGMDNGGLPTVQGDWNQDYREALMAISRYFDRLALGMEPGAPGEHSVLFQKGSTAAAPAPATGTITMATSSGVVGATIGGTLVTVTWAISDANSQVLLATAINADATVNKWVYATASGAVCTLTALQPGVLGNNVTLALSGTNVTVSGAKLTGGVGADQSGTVAATGTITIASAATVTVGADINGIRTTVAWATSDTATALALSQAINAVANHPVQATAALGVVTLRARQPGVVDYNLVPVATGLYSLQRVSNVVTATIVAGGTHAVKVGDSISVLNPSGTFGATVTTYTVLTATTTTFTYAETGANAGPTTGFTMSNFAATSHVKSSDSKLTGGIGTSISANFAA